ncbi:MAG: PPC domain-containing protein, partial [Bacteroidota bacterium]|nr:PPC domain-containing protein [Bacteroidota bacterium]
MKIKEIYIFLFLSLIANISTKAQAYIGYVYPAGGQQGKSVEVVVGGQNLSDVKGVFINGKEITGAIIEKIPVNLKEKSLRIKEQDIPQIEEKVKLKINIGKKAELGLHDLRLETESGFTNRVFFEVNELPETNEVEPNDVPSNACQLPKLPCVVNGQILPGERDCFRFSASKGETIVCYTRARLLVPYLADAVPGWFQPILTLRNAEGKEVAYNDDFGDNPDPVIIYKVPQTGNYTVEIKDAVYRGREDFVYRISIGEIPFVKSIFPLGGATGQKTKVALEGVNLSKNTLNVKAKKNSESKIYLTAKGKGLHSNVIKFGTSSGKELLTNKDNSISNPMYLPLGSTVNGRIASPGQEDWYAVDGKAGTNMVIQIMAHRLGSLLDADLTLYNENNKVLAQVDDFPDKSEGMETFHADPQLVYRVVKNGKIFIRVRDVLGKGGTAYGYRLFTGRPTPDFDLRINPSNLTINQDGTTSFTVFALRKYNFMGEINLKLNGLPAGFTHSNNIIQKGQNQLLMTVTAPKDAKLGILNLEITGRSEANNTVVEHKAEPVEERMQAFFYQHLLPTGDFITSVVPSLPVTISHDIPVDSVVKISKDSSFTFKVRIKRAEGFNFPVQLVLDNPKGLVKMKPVVVPATASEATVTLEMNANVFNQNLNLVVSGICRVPKTRTTKAKVYKALSPAIMVETPKRVVSRPL